MAVAKTNRTQVLKQRKTTKKPKKPGLRKPSEPESNTTATAPVPTFRSRGNDAARNELGFLVDSDLARAWTVIKEGGTSRVDVHHKLVALFDGELTSTEKAKPVSTIMNQVMARARAMGYTVQEGGWHVVAPATEVDYRTVVKRRSAPNKTAAKKAVKSPKKTAAKKTAKKVTKTATSKPLKPAFKGLKKKAV